MSDVTAMIPGFHKTRACGNVPEWVVIVNISNSAPQPIKTGACKAASPCNIHIML